MRQFCIPVLCLFLLEGAVAQSQDARAYLGQGLVDLQQARFALAAEAFEKAVATDPTLILARYDLGVSYFADGRFLNARKAFEGVVQLEPDHRFARYYLARLDLLDDRTEPAIRALEALAAQGLGTDEFYLLGTAYLKKGQVSDGIARLKHAASVNPGDSRVHFQLARAYQKLGNSEAASVEYKLSSEVRDEDQKRSRDIASCESALNARNEDPVARCHALLDGDDTIRLIALGTLLAQRSDLQGALVPFQKAARLDPDNYAPHFNLGLTYFNLKQYSDARIPLERAVTLRPESFAAVALLGSALSALGDDVAATDYLRRAHQLQPGDPKIRALLLQELAVLAQEATRTAKYEQAAQLSREALSLAPDSADFHNLLGFCLLQEGERTKARESFQLAIAANHDFSPAHRNLAGMLVLEGHISEAIPEFAAVLRLNPGDSAVGSVVFDLAKQRFSAADYSAAVELLQLAKPAMEDTAEWHELMGYSRYRLGDSVQAVAELQSALDKAPRNEDYVLELAEVFIAGNNSGAALALLQPALKVFPNSARVWFAMGVAQLANSDLARSESALRRALEVDPKLDLAYQVLAHGYRDAGMWDKLSEAARALIDVNPGNHFGYFYQALVLLRGAHAETGNIEGLLRKSITLDGSDPEPRYELAKLLLEKGDKSGSAQELEALIKVSPDYGKAYYRLYQLYKDSGDFENSKEALEIYQQLRAQRGLPVRELIVKVRQP